MIDFDDCVIKKFFNRLSMRVGKQFDREILFVYKFEDCFHKNVDDIKKFEKILYSV